MRFIQTLFAHLVLLQPVLGLAVAGQEQEADHGRLRGLLCPKRHTSTCIHFTVTETKTATVTQSRARTITVTKTATSKTPNPTACGNQGLQWALYPNKQGNIADPTYSQFDPTVYKTEKPEFHSVTSTIGGIDEVNPGNISIYNSSFVFQSDFFVLNHRGYFFVPASGTYTITIDKPDDLVEVWIGPNAFSGWTRPNGDAIAIFPGAGTSATFTANQGDYVPIRIIYANAQGSAIFGLTVTKPDGTVLLDSTTPSSPNIVQYACQRSLGPMYPPFGQET